MDSHWLQMKSGQLIGFSSKTVNDLCKAFDLIQGNYDHFYGLEITISQIA